MSKSLSSIKSTETKDDLLNSKIYKVKHLVDGKINTIYVFNVIKTGEENEEGLFNKIFTEEENRLINEEKITIKFSKQYIHFDDSIGTIKIKILNELKKEISIDEIYLFCQKLETLNAVSVYQSLTQNKKIELTKVRLDQFISNIDRDEDGEPFSKPEDKEVYTFDDIFQMKFDNKKYIVNKVLGQKFFIVENEYPFVCNPYDIDDYDVFFEKIARKSLSTLNNHLLLNSGEIVDNSIYLCLANEVLHFIKEKGEVSEETTTKIYYPFLYNKNINGLEDLEKERPKLLESNKKVLNEKTLDTFKTIDMFYEVYNSRKSELNYVDKGIKFIKAIIRPDFDIKIPLEIIFKIVHATESNPLIKYNPSSRQENVYRLFTDKIATDGRKIPFLKRAVIFKLMKNIGRNKSVAIYVESEQTLICEFDEEGFITISSEFKSLVSVDEIDDIFRNSINPIIEEIKNLLEQSGYKLNLFNSLHDENVEIKELTYETQITIKKALDIQSYRGCISSVFINETDDFKGKAINLRYKRVSNYSKFNSQEAFILEKSNQGLRGAEIIDALLENFPEDLTRKDAVEMVTRVANELEIERGVRKSDIKIKNNPGFKTIITLDKETGIITITTENINNINYLYTLPIYLDTMVRLTQDKKSTNFSLKEIDKLCLSGEKEEIVLEEIVSPTEGSSSLDQDEEEASLEPGTEDIELEISKPKGALSLFMNESDEEEEESFEGGDSSSSEKSIPSEKSSEKPDSSSSEQSIPSEKSSEKPDTSSSEVSIVSEENASKSSEPISDNSESTKSLKSFGVSSSKSETNISNEPTPNEPTPDISESAESLKSFGVSSSKSEEVVEEPEKEKSSSEDILTLEPEPGSSSSKKSENVKFIMEDSSEDEEEEVKEDEEEEEEEEEEDLEPTFKKVEEETMVRNIDGMKLKKPYYFQTLIEKKDPILILKEDTPQYNSYPRTCSSNMRRQPVILTDTQLDKINKEHPGFLREEDVIKYGSDETKQFNYICPRYWCLKTNTIIDPADLKQVKGKDGKIELEHPECGKVLPKGEKKVKPGYYIYEFYSNTPGKKDNKKYPSLIPDKHPNGLCLPCCFDKYNTEGRIAAMKKCYKKDQEKVVKEKDNQEDYIKGPDKFPLEQGRWGYLPVEIQTMLHESNADCQISKTNTNLKENHPCLLRHGIELNKNQSFIACISDIIFYAKKVIDKENKSAVKSTKILNIQEMKNHIIKSLTIDTFIKYQNGNLVTDFQDINKKVDVNKYNTSKIFSKLDMAKSADLAYYSKVVSAFENFKAYLNDPDAIIDHTYLWDIISMPNKFLFPNGVNLIIFQIPNDDITNNVNLLCPSNHYSNEFYEARKPTIILIKEEGYYEPIYSYTSSNNNVSIIKEFKEYDPKLSKTMRAVFKEIIKPFFNMICRPLESMPTIYKAKRPLLLYDLVQKLDKYEYKVLKLVLNFSNKVIGVVAEEPGTSERFCFVPCYPSYLNEDLKKDLDFVFMNDVSLWNTYENTVQFLNKLDKRSKKRREEADIPCKPEFKIIEDDVMVVGILTNTNQFIQLSTPIRADEISSELDLPSINNSNYIINSKAKPMLSSDIPITTEIDVDKERVDYIKKIKLETSFYNVFRNTIRILLNNYENAKIREKIEKEILKEYIIYSEKLRNMIDLLHDLVKEKIQFIGDENYYKLINEISTCIVKNKESCSATPNLCAVSENNDCNLILPEKNLITNKENETIYYGKMADELIRYNRIKSFMLQPQTYLSFGNIGYNLRDNEIILIQSLLTKEYFETLIPTITNKYIHSNSYDETQPIITQVYENQIPSLDHAIGRDNEKVCDKIVNEKIKSAIWKSCFPENYSEIEYSKYKFCTFNFMIDLIEKKTGNRLTMNQIKNELYDEYKKYLPEHADKIIDILIIEGKKTLGDQVHSKTLSFLNLIYTDNYFLTTIDIWLLILKYKIPTIFISQKWILQTKYEKHQFVAYGNKDDKFAFIVIPGFRPENVPNLKLIQSDENDVFISLDKLNEECVEKIKEDIDEQVTIEDYLENFIKPIKTQYEKKKPARLVIESNSDEPIIKPKKKKKLVIEETSSVSHVLEEEPEEKVKKVKEPKRIEKSKKNIKIRGNASKKNIKKKKFLIVNSSSTEELKG